MKNRTTKSFVMAAICWWLLIWVFEKDPIRHLLWTAIFLTLDVGFTLAIQQRLQGKKDA